MKVSHLATAALVSIVVILSGNLLFGVYSGDRYEELVAHRDRLAENVEELKHRHTALQARVELLRRSSDAVAVEARRLQYYAGDEIVIRIDEMPSRPSQQSPGRVILGRTETHANRRLLRFIAFVAGVGSFLVLVLSDRRKDRMVVTR